MNKELIEKWAAESTLQRVGERWIADKYSLERFAALVAAHEREQCALVCDDLGARYWAKDDAIESLSCEECAAAIRSRKDAP